MTETRLSSGLEDYLEYIYNAVEEKGSVKAIDIAKEHNISRASVTDALQRLAAKEYINYESPSPLTFRLYQHQGLFK